MRKKKFENLMNSYSGYIDESDVLGMSEEQLNEFRQTHNPYVVWSGCEGEFHYTKLDEWIVLMEVVNGGR